MLERQLPKNLSVLNAFEKTNRFTFGGILLITKLTYERLQKILGGNRVLDACQSCFLTQHLRLEMLYLYKLLSLNVKNGTWANQKQAAPLSRQHYTRILIIITILYTKMNALLKCFHYLRSHWSNSNVLTQCLFKIL